MTKLSVLFKLLVLSITLKLSSSSLTNYSNSTPSFREYSLKYVGESYEYDVTTDDGYILKLFRIPGDKTRPVLLMHGLIGSADDFIIRGNTSLAVSLARNGFDVWVGNCRGNRYSRRHTALIPDTDTRFWDFSFHEYGYDIATFIDHILKITEQSNLRLIALSQGVTSAFALASTRPEYNAKIKVVVALGPVVYLNDLPPPFPELLPFFDVITDFQEKFGLEEIAGFYSPLAELVKTVCAQRQFYQICLNWLFYPMTGFDPPEFEYEFATVMFQHLSSGSSRKNCVHFRQLVASGKFQKFDYGLAKNLAVYGTWKPPQYDISKLTMDTYILSAKNDKMATPTNVALLQHKLQNCKCNYVMKSASFNHVGFILGKTGHKIAAKLILKILEKYN